MTSPARARPATRGSAPAWPPGDGWPAVDAFKQKGFHVIKEYGDYTTDGKFPNFDDEDEVLEYFILLEKKRLADLIVLFSQSCTKECQVMKIKI